MSREAKFKDVNQLIDILSLKNPVEATKLMTNYFVKGRFALSAPKFDVQYVDGSNDGGIDFYHREDDTFYIIQSKFSGKTKKADKFTIFHELDKLYNTLTGQNPNKDADTFVNEFRRNVISESILEVIWLTTNTIDSTLAAAAQAKLEDFRKNSNWKMNVEFITFDYFGLQRLVDDVNYGNIPYTGRQELPISKGIMENPGDSTGICSIVSTVRINDILKWFNSEQDVEKFLKKNIREYLGEKEINLAIQHSYKSDAEWFWYRHNGIILFADSVSKTPDGSKLVLRNPQIVNGGQTLSALFLAYDKAARKDSDAEVILRVYRFPYENSEIYEKGIKIIEALNSQNHILSSDLHSTDSRQVRLQDLIENQVVNFRYFRKRGKNVKSSRHGITMRNLALYYNVCKKVAPHEGVGGQLEKIFEEKQRYDDTFPEIQICADLALNHPVIAYITVWLLEDSVEQLAKKLPKRLKELSQYTKWFVLSDVFQKTIDWKKTSFDLKSWRDWIDFIESPEFEMALLNYAKLAFKVSTALVPPSEDPRRFFKAKEATKKYAAKMIGARQFTSKMNQAFNLFKKPNN